MVRYRQVSSFGIYERESQSKGLAFGYMRSFLGPRECEVGLLYIRS